MKTVGETGKGEGNHLRKSESGTHMRILFYCSFSENNKFLALKWKKKLMRTTTMMMEFS